MNVIDVHGVQLRSKRLPDTLHLLLISNEVIHTRTSVSCVAVYTCCKYNILTYVLACWNSTVYSQVWDENLLVAFVRTKFCTSFYRCR